MGLVAAIAILPGVGCRWKARASSSVKVRFSASLMAAAGPQMASVEMRGRTYRPGPAETTLVELARRGGGLAVVERSAATLVGPALGASQTGERSCRRP